VGFRPTVRATIQFDAWVISILPSFEVSDVDDFQTTKASVQAVLEKSVRSARHDPLLMAELREIVRRALDVELDLGAGSAAPARTLDEPRVGPWVHDLRRLKQAAGLTDEELGQLFGVSRGSVQGWLHRSQEMRPDRQRHLNALLSVIEDAARRLGEDERALRYALLTRVGKQNKSPFDYLREREYRLARGLLHVVSTPAETGAAGLRILAEYPVAATAAEREAALEELSPSFRVD
jgi:transcriptional regulator with XRE-family HTH domain